MPQNPISANRQVCKKVLLHLLFFRIRQFMIDKEKCTVHNVNNDAEAMCKFADAWMQEVMNDAQENHFLKRNMADGMV